MRDPSKQPDLVGRVAAGIREARIKRRLTQEALAGRLGIATKNLQRMESGRQNLTLATVERVADALGIDPEELLAGRARSPLGALGKSGIAVLPAGPRSQAMPPHAVPVLRIEAAAGFARSGRPVDVLGWALLPRAGGEREFIAQVQGRSMEPLIPDGAWCLFRAGSVSATPGEIVLVEHHDPIADAVGGMVLKRIGPKKKRGVALVLESFNREHAPIEVSARERHEWRVVAAFVAVVAVT